MFAVVPAEEEDRGGSNVIAVDVRRRLSFVFVLVLLPLLVVVVFPFSTLGVVVDCPGLLEYTMTGFAVAVAAAAADADATEEDVPVVGPMLAIAAPKKGDIEDDDATNAACRSRRRCWK